MGPIDIAQRNDEELHADLLHILSGHAILDDLHDETRTYRIFRIYEAQQDEESNPCNHN